MRLTKIQQKFFEKNGYLVVKNIFTKSDCRKISTLVKRNQNRLIISELDKDHPFSKIKTDSKVSVLNKINEKKLYNISNIDKILQIGSKLREKEMKKWFIKFYLKNAFDGDNEFYHQDFAYHKDKKAKNSDYLQCFVAFEDHKLGSGCLRVFKGSHKIGLIKHYLVMTRNGLSKLTPCSKELVNLSKRFELVNLELKAGSCVFFDYKLLHGSSSNASENSQLRMVYQMISSNSKRDEKKNRQIWLKRNKQEIDILKKIINYKTKFGGKKIN